MVQFCIESVDPAFEMERTHADGETWREWVDPYIVDSKRIVTVRRNDVRFRRLDSLGVDAVERKDGIRIQSSEFELDMHWRETLSEYASLHEPHCTEFARELLERADGGIYSITRGRRDERSSRIWRRDSSNATSKNCSDQSRSCATDWPTARTCSLRSRSNSSVRWSTVSSRFILRTSPSGGISPLSDGSDPVTRIERLGRASPRPVYE